MSIYTSQGTISVRCSLSNSNRQDIFFVPHDDYHIKHRNKTFAVFVPQSCDCTPQSCNEAIIREYDRDKGNGVKIRAAASNCTVVISAAAVHRTKIEISVKKKKKKLKLTDITVPDK